jgi:hypothetical protein
VIKREIHIFEHKGEQTVREAAILLGKLPKGWKLQTFAYDQDTWVAEVHGPGVGVQ